MDKLNIAKDFFFNKIAPSFRPGQLEAISSVMSGRNTLAVFATGFGKSAIYQAVSVGLGKPVLVLGPLISLHRDQVQNAQRLGLRAGLKNSSQNEKENRESLQSLKDSNIFLMAPESLESAMDILLGVDLGAIVIDEAHFAEESLRFRPAYGKIKKLINTKGCPVLAVTGTCTDKTRRAIKRDLGIIFQEEIIGPPVRENLIIESFNLQHGEIWQLMSAFQGQSGMIFSITINGATGLANELKTRFPEQESTLYHGQLPAKKKNSAQDLYMGSEGCWVSCTNAFGTGINKADCRFALHRHHCLSLLQQIQEIGRAGRDGKPASCFLVLEPGYSYRTQEWMISCATPSREKVEKYWRALRAFGVNRFRGSEVEINENWGKLYGKYDAPPQSQEVMAIKNILTRFNVLSTRVPDEGYGVDILCPETKSSSMVRKAVLSGLVKLKKFFSGKIKLSDMAEECGVSEKTLSGQLSELKQEGCLNYVSPDRRCEWRLLESDLSLVDWDIVVAAREEALDDFEKCKEFYQSENKGEFLTNYFLKSNIEEKKYLLSL